MCDSAIPISIKGDPVKLLVPLAIAVAVITMPTTSWAADPVAVAGCPPKMELLSVEDTLKKVDWKIYDAETKAAIEGIIADVDTNGNDDGYLCSVLLKPNQGQDKKWGATDYVATKIGDNKPTGQL